MMADVCLTVFQKQNYKDKLKLLRVIPWQLVNIGSSEHPAARPWSFYHVLYTGSVPPATGTFKSYWVIGNDKALV